MPRTIDTATAAALVAPTLYLVWLLRLDVQGDPVYIHTGFGSLYFGSGLGYDPALVGYTFLGAGNVGSIEAVTDASDGSQSLNLVLPGVDITLDYLHQLVASGDKWQRYAAYIWIATMDATGALVGKPIRIKRGRMDQMLFTIDPNNQTGTLTVTIESQAAWSGEALNSRYSEQSQIDSTDTSQNFVADLANRTPEIGNTKSNASGGTGNAYSYSNLHWGGHTF